MSTEAADAMALVINNTQGLIEEYYQATSQTDEDCFYVPAIDHNQAVVFRGQCETMIGMEGFDAQRVSNKLPNLTKKYINKHR